LGAPIVAAGRVFIGGADGYVYVLDATTGECIETCDLGMPLAANPAVVGEQLYIGGCDGFVYAFAIGS
jgi:outer membrane protein assembly factor BamB